MRPHQKRMRMPRRLLPTTASYAFASSSSTKSSSSLLWLLPMSQPAAIQRSILKTAVFLRSSPSSLSPDGHQCSAPAVVAATVLQVQITVLRASLPLPFIPLSVRLLARSLANNSTIGRHIVAAEQLPRGLLTPAFILLCCLKMPPTGSLVFSSTAVARVVTRALSLQRCCRQLPFDTKAAFTRPSSMLLKVFIVPHA